jgi:hypothetical protein
MVVTTVVFVAGVVLKTFNFEFKGLTGLLLQDAAIASYSFVSVGQFAPVASGDPDSFTVRWMEVSYFAFGIGMPVALIFSLMVLWFVPLRLGRQRQLYVLAEVPAPCASLP